MKILMLNHNIIGRGSYLRCLNLARMMVRKGHQVDLVTTAADPSFGWEERQIEGVRVLLPPRWCKAGKHDGGYAPVDILSRIPLVLQKWDLVHAFEHRPNVLLPAWLAHLKGIPLVSDWSDWWTRGGITTPRRPFAKIDEWEATWLEEGSKKISDHVTLVSECLWNRALSIGIPESKLSLIPSGCDHERIHVRDQKDCRHLLGLPESVPIVDFVGFAFWDFSFLLKAFSLVLDQIPESLLVVVGLDKDDQVMNLATKILGSRISQIHFAGIFPPERIEIPLGAADVHLLPLENSLMNRARWPIKFGDYLVSGRPQVITRVGDTPLLLEQYQAGVVTDANPEDFSRGILELLQNPEKSKQMGLAARALAEGAMSWMVRSEQMIQVYDHCLS